MWSTILFCHSIIITTIKNCCLTHLRNSKINSKSEYRSLCLVVCFDHLILYWFVTKKVEKKTTTCWLLTFLRINFFFIGHAINLKLTFVASTCFRCEFIHSIEWKKNRIPDWNLLNAINVSYFSFWESFIFTYYWIFKIVKERPDII